MAGVKGIRIYYFDLKNKQLEIDHGSWAAFDPVGSRLIVALANRPARLWHLDDLRGPVDLPGERDGQRAQEAVPSRGYTIIGRWVASWSTYESGLGVWDVSSRTAPSVRRLPIQSRAVYGAHLSPDGRHLAVRDADGVLRVWNLDEMSIDPIFTAKRAP